MEAVRLFGLVTSRILFAGCGRRDLRLCMVLANGTALVSADCQMTARALLWLDGWCLIFLSCELGPLVAG
jgi:hypothetical protein